MISRIAFLLTAALFAGACASTQMSSPVPGQQHPGFFETDVRTTVILDYLIYYPEGFDSEDREWPLMVFLHGLGERGPDLDKVKIHGPPKLIDEGQQFPFVVLSPQCPARDWWANEAPTIALEKLIDHVLSDPRIDENRVYLTGLSMGGFGTWNLALRNPDVFAAIAPVCGGGDPSRAYLIAGLPVWAFHGAKDTVVLPERSEEMIQSIEIAGGSPRYTVYPEAAHNSWTRTYDNPELYEWFLSHEKGD